jgi:hypothetical protein
MSDIYRSERLSVILPVMMITLKEMALSVANMANIHNLPIFNNILFLEHNKNSGKGFINCTEHIVYP